MLQLNKREHLTKMQVLPTVLVAVQFGGRMLASECVCVCVSVGFSVRLFLTMCDIT